MFDRQRLLREVNDRVADVGREEHLDNLDFLCECGREDCFASLTMSLAEYTRTAEAGFILAEGHDPIREDAA